MLLKKHLKLFIRRVGFRCLRESSLPRGLDPCVDLREASSGASFGLIVDVGGNIGQSVHIFREAFPTSTIVSCEPSPEAFKKLRNRYDSNPAVRLENVALGDVNGTAILELVNPLSELNRISRPGASTHETKQVQVQMETLDSLLSRLSIESVDLLKIDTEGYEMEVLRGGEKSFKMSRIHAVLAECSFDSSDTQHSFFFSIYDFLNDRGFNFLGLYGVHHLGGQLHYCNALFKLAS